MSDISDINSVSGARGTNAAYYDTNTASGIIGASDATDTNTARGKLYLCGTPIGNLADFSPRGIDALKNADLIAAEDTRVTLKLLNHFDIKTPLTSYYEHNKIKKGDMLIEKLLSGTNIALVSDAGMPVISDPGEDLVRQCRKNGIEVTVIPGPCAAISALALSGISGVRFAFEGFLPVNKKERAERLDEIKNDTRTLIFYEAPHKISGTLSDLFSALGNREIAVCREITKKFEEVLYSKLSDAVSHFEKTVPKGEFVLVVSGESPEKLEQKKRESLPTAEELIKTKANEGLYGKELVKAVAEELSLPKREVYSIYLKAENKL